MNGYARHSHVLKIFSGPHLGAEVLLGAGSYTIGSGGECEIILNDQLIAPRHARICISDEKIECESVENAPLLLDGKPQESVVLAPFQYFTLGNTHMAIGPADQPWPLMNFTDFTLGQASSESDARPTDAKKLPRLAARKLGRILHSRYGAIAIAALLVAALAACYHVCAAYMIDTDRPAIDNAGMARRLKEIISECAPDAIVDVKCENEQFFVRGYVDNGEQQRRLERRLRETSPAVIVRLWNSDQLVRSASEILGISGLSLTVAKGTPGEVVVRGEVADGKRWREVLEQLRHDLPTIRLLSQQVQVAGVSVQNSPAKRAKLPGGPVEKVFIGESSNGGEAGPHDIRAINIGAYAWIVRRDGCRIFPGGTFEGDLVKAIKPEGIVLSRSGGERVLSLQGAN